MAFQKEKQKAIKEMKVHLAHSCLRSANENIYLCYFINEPKQILLKFLRHYDVED